MHPQSRTRESAIIVYRNSPFLLYIASEGVCLPLSSCTGLQSKMLFTATNMRNAIRCDGYDGVNEDQPQDEIPVMLISRERTTVEPTV